MSKEVNGNRYRVYRREWLNEEGFHSNAFVFAYVHDTSHKKETEDNKVYSPWPALKIGDCRRSIELSLDLGRDPKENANTMKKLDTLIGVLEEVREAVRAEMDLAEQRGKKRKEMGWGEKQHEALTLLGD